MRRKDSVVPINGELGFQNKCLSCSEGKIRGFASTCFCVWCFPHGSDGKESICNAEDPGSIPVSGRSPGEGFVFVFG